MIKTEPSQYSINGIELDRVRSPQTKRSRLGQFNWIDTIAYTRRHDWSRAQATVSQGLTTVLGSDVQLPENND